MENFSRVINIIEGFLKKGKRYRIIVKMKNVVIKLGYGFNIVKK